jgi:hypothetical protein
VSSLAHVVSVRPIAEGDLAYIVAWQRQRSIEPPAAATWVELGCRFSPPGPGDSPELLLFAPATLVAIGDRLDVEAATHMDTIMPSSPDDGPPVGRAVATAIVPGDQGWVAECARGPAGAQLCIFGADGLLTAEVFRGLLPGAGVLMIGYPEAGCVEVVSMDFGLASRATLAVSDTRDFAVFVPRGLPPELSRARRAGRSMSCSWPDASTLIWRDGSGAETVVPCAAPPAVDLAVLPAVDYFATAGEAPEAIRIDRPGGLPADALGVITSQRPSGAVTLCVDSDDRLLIGTPDPSSAGLAVDGPGFATHLGHRGVVLTVPYWAAVALHAGARYGAVSVWTDRRWGFVIHEQRMAQLVWSTVQPASA